MLHQFIKDHVRSQFPDCEIIVATNPDEQWVVIIDGVAYVAQMSGDDEELYFHPVIRGTRMLPATFTVTLTDEQWQRLTNVDDQ